MLKASHKFEIFLARSLVFTKEAKDIKAKSDDLFSLRIFRILHKMCVAKADDLEKLSSVLGCDPLWATNEDVVETFQGRDVNIKNLVLFDKVRL